MTIISVDLAYKRYFISFSIEVYNKLLNLGWSLLNHDALASFSNYRLAIESFPTSAWRSLGISPIPSKKNQQMKI